MEHQQPHVQINRNLPGFKAQIQNIVVVVIVVVVAVVVVVVVVVVTVVHFNCNAR